MRLRILLADSREIVRWGLRALFIKISIVADFYEVVTEEELKECLLSHPVDLVMVHQSLVTDFTALPKGHFVVMTNEPDMSTLLYTYNHGGIGYLCENASAELLRITLYLATKQGERMFIVDPSIVPVPV